MLDVLIIGTGLIGRKRAAALPNTMYLKQCFDIDIESSKSFAQIYSCEHNYSLEEAISKVTRGSLAIIAVKHIDLYQIALKCIHAGIHVLIEKPGAINLDQIENLISKSSIHGVTISVGYNHRFHGAAGKLREITNSKIYGPVQLVRARYGHGGRVGYEKEWRGNSNLSGGGELLDQGSHLLDLMRFFGGELTLEFSMLPTLYWNIEVEDNAFLAGAFSDSAKFWIHASWTEWKNIFSFEVFYKTAKVEWAGLNGSYGQEKLMVYHMAKGLGIPNYDEFVFDNPDESWRDELIEIQKRIVGQHSYSASGEDAAQVLKIIGKAYAK